MVIDNQKGFFLYNDCNLFYRGGHSPSYLYRLISELYHPDDTDL